MFEGKDVKVFLAQAGAGKTSKLLDVIRNELETRLPEELALVTFTRAGAREGLHRTCNFTGYTPNDLPYFCTLHSLTYNALNMETKKIFTLKYEKEFNQKYGYSLNRAMIKGNRNLLSRDSQYLDYYDLERTGTLTTKTQTQSDIDLVYYHQLVHSYEEYKSQQSLVDFFDCLIKYVQVGDSLPVKVAFIDEAQDITSLQWQVIEKAFRNAEKIYVAGDDTQSIFSYSGSRPDILIDLTKTFPVEYLDKSYRIPKKVYELAKGISGMIEKKAYKPFNFYEKNEEGSITNLHSMEQLGNLVSKSHTTKTWYLLARNNYSLEEYKNMLEEKTIPYWTNEGFFINTVLLKRIADYYHYAKSEPSEEKEKFAKMYGIQDFSAPFAQWGLFNETRKWIYYTYVERYGVEGIRALQKEYPSVLVSSIHQVKGGEADNVVIMMDISRKVSDSITSDVDSELRVLYVGVTRTKQNLFFLDAKTPYNYNDILDVVKDNYKLNW